ncbi:MAG TPA: LPD38 domain-containing protein, partial [Usitatibacter sp.]|nr:LPD38 domain-containing protein [Usitatibacter sp.]
AAEPATLGMPAHVVTADEVGVSAGGASPPGRASSKVRAEEARPDAIRKAMAELFDTVVNEKHQGARNLGIYRIKPETIRVRNRNDLRTIAHEVGHHISNRNQSFRDVMRAHANELIPMMPEGYKQKLRAGGHMPKKLQIEEGFAEFVAEYFGDRATAQEKAPGFYAAFEGWLEKHKPYREALDHVSDMIAAHSDLGPAERILAKVGAYKEPLRERVAGALSRETYDQFAQETLDKTHAFKLMVQDLAPDIAASKNPHIAARLLPGDAAIVEDWVFDFTSPFDYQKRLDPKNYGKPLKAVLDPILEQGPEVMDKFKAYLIARRAQELKAAGKENLFSNSEIRGGLSLETPQFKEVAKEVYAYSDRALDYAVEGGLLSPELAAKFREYTAYIPFFREAEGGGKPGGQGSPFKRLTGGTENLRDPIANLVQNTANIIHATNRNAVLRKSVELAKAVRGGGRWMETVPLPNEAHRIATKRIMDQLAEQGVKIDADMAENLAAVQTFFTKSGKGDERARVIVYKDGGELKAAQVNDPLLWRAINSMGPLELGLIGKMLAFPAQTLRAGVVLDPTFMVRNFVRDTLTSTLQTKGNFIPVKSTAEGMKLMAQGADSYKLWRAFGGAYSEYGPSELRGFADNSALIKRMAQRGGFKASSILSPWRLYHAWKRLGSYTESGSRIGEFKETYKPGDFDSALQAALNSREISTDFGMRGSSEAVQAWTRIVPFMNPAMQGIYKTARVLGGADGRRAQIRAAVVGSGMALASIYLALKNSDEQWYQELEEWEKATYWHFKLGGEIWRVPKPFEYGMLFASIPEATALYEAGKETGEDFKKRMIQVLDQVLFRVVPQIATIAAEPWANKSFFTGRKIVPDSAERLEPGLQSTPSTSKVAQVAGGAANVSPAVIDNVVRNLFGTVGVQVEAAADMLLEQTGAFPSARDKTWRTWPAVRAFVHDPENPNSKSMNDFYDALDRYRKAVGTVKELRRRGEDVKADKYAMEHDEELQSAHQAEVTARKMGKLRAKIRAIQWDRDLSPQDKRSEINAYNEELNALAREHTRLYQSAKSFYSRPASEGGK